MSFITLVSELPLLISFEAKSLGEVKFKLAQARMISLGYAVARYANDGFALLRGDRMFQKKDSSSDGVVVYVADSASVTIESSVAVEEKQLPPEVATVEKIGGMIGMMTDAGPEEDQEPV